MTFYQELQLNQAGSKNLLNGILFFICYYFQYLIWK